MRDTKMQASQNDMIVTQSPAREGHMSKNDQTTEFRFYL